MDEEKEKMKTGKKLVIALIMILLILTAGAYGYGVHYFTDHFLPGSQVNGFNCSYKTADETEKLLAKEVQAYVLTVDTRNNGKESITAKEAGLVYKPDGGAKKLIKKQDRYKWFLAFNQKKKYTLATDTAYEDQNKLTEAVKNLKCMQKDNMEKPADACIKDNGETYEIQPEKEGTTLDTKKVQKVIRAAVSAGDKTVSLEKKNCYKKPSIYKDDEALKKDCDQMNKLTSCVITYDFSDRSEQLDRNTIKDWLQFDEKGQLVWDDNSFQQHVADYVAQLAATYDTVGTEREFQTTSGRTVYVSSSVYGWKIDQSAETAQLSKEIQSGTQTTREPVFSQTANAYGVNDLGNTYIEVDLSEQHMYYYQNGADIFESDFVSGNMSYADRQTHAGIFTLYYKKSPDVLRGTMKADGTYEYESKVEYWMPFDGGIGFHDASWRDEFGGDIYLTDGSHGCINMPPENAGILYDLIQYDVPIVCFY